MTLLDKDIVHRGEKKSYKTFMHLNSAIETVTKLLTLSNREKGSKNGSKNGPKKLTPYCGYVKIHTPLEKRGASPSNSNKKVQIIFKNDHFFEKDVLKL